MLDAAKVFKLWSERPARIAKDWITLDEPEALSFLGDMTAETMNASSLIRDERYSMAVAESGVDVDTLHQIAKNKGDEAMFNLATVLEQESAVLVDPTWDAKEKAEWLRKVGENAEQEALCLDLEKLIVSPPSVPDLSEKLVVLKLERMCLDLSNLLIDETKSLQALSKDLAEIEAEPFNIEDYRSFTPSSEERVFNSSKPQLLEPDADVDDFLKDL